VTDAFRDVECLQRVRAGDESALSELYDRYIGLVFPVAVRIVGDPAEAEDVMQDVWLQVWRRADSYDASRGAFAAWLITITRSRALDLVRGRSARARRETRVGRESEVTVVPTPAHESTRSREVIRRALEGLDAHKREVLELAYWQGLSQSEIAEKLKTPLGTVKSWTRQALRDLKLALPEGGES
jgi:RNA polymerase sigma-70 factor (ECF subfamily)